MKNALLDSNNGNKNITLENCVHQRTITLINNAQTSWWPCLRILFILMTWDLVTSPQGVDGLRLELLNYIGLRVEWITS